MLAIHRSTNPPKLPRHDILFTTAYSEIQTFVSQDTFLKSSVMDLQRYGDVLVALIDGRVPGPFIQARLENLWPGDIEVHCATDIFAG